MKISTARNLLLAVDMALFAGAAGVVYKELENKEARKESHQAYERDLKQQIEALEGLETPSSARKAKEPYKHLNTPMIPKKEEPKVEKGPTAIKEPEPPKTPIADLLNVHGILAGGEPSMAFIVPKDAELAKENTGFYQLNEVIEWAQGAVITQIEPNKVTFELRGQSEAIMVLAGEVSGPDKKKATRKPGAKAAPIEVTPAVLRNPAGLVQWKKGSSKVVVTRTGVAATKEYGEEVIKGVTWSRFKLQDGKEAVRVDKIPQDSVLRRGGMQEGDAVHSINGVRVRSKAEIVSYVRSNPNLPQYQVRIFRNGRLVTRTVTAER